MKRLFLFLFLNVVLVSITTSVFAQTPKVILQHDGAVTLFEANQLQSAINAAVEGDVIYLGEGTYNSGYSSVSINKRISIIGAGQKSKIYGTVYITFSENEFSGSHGYLLESLNITSGLAVTSAINDFRIKKVKIDNGLALDDTNAKINSATIDNCQMGNLSYSTRIASLHVNNSKIKNLYSSYSCCTLTNCNIYYYRNSNYGSVRSPFEGNIVNSIIYTLEDYSYAFLANNGQAINSLYVRTWSSGAQVQNCYVDSDIKINESTLECNYSNDNLISKGYFGQDGTVVGIYGGTNPFTLEPNTPSVYDSNISVDNATNKLKVTLKVKVE